VSNRDINIFYPINKTFAQTIEETVIIELEKVMKPYDRYNCVDHTT
jgi:hypothetical protein